MFKIECFCEDKRLPQVLLALQGLILAGPSVVPVVNAGVKNGEVRAQTDGTIAELFASHLRKNKIKEFRAKDVKPFLQSIGRAPSSYSHCLVESLKAGVIRRTGKGMSARYVVK